MMDGFAKKHLPLTEDIFKYISKTIDFEQCNDYFSFKSGEDNGEILMDELDDYFQNAHSKGVLCIFCEMKDNCEARKKDTDGK